MKKNKKNRTQHTVSRSNEPFFSAQKKFLIQRKIEKPFFTPIISNDDISIGPSFDELLQKEPNKEKLLKYHPQELKKKTNNPIFMAPWDGDTKSVLLDAIKTVRLLATGEFAKQYELEIAKVFPKKGQEAIKNLNQWGKVYHFNGNKPVVWNDVVKDGKLKAKGLTYEDYKKRIGNSDDESQKIAPELKAASKWGGNKVNPIALSFEELKQILLPESPKNDELVAEHESRIKKYLPFINDAFETMGIDTVKTQALYFAHAAGETSSFSILEEKPNTETNRYKPFVGRGPFQTTFRPNYVRLLAYLEKRKEQLDKRIATNMKNYWENKNNPGLNGANLGFAALALTNARETMEKSTKIKEAFEAIKKDVRAAANPKYSFIFGAAHMHMARMTNPSPKLGDTGTFEAGTPEVRGVTDSNQVSASMKKRKKFKKETYARAVQVLKKKVIPNS